jgi:D-beta-D-heptose 7-phosphate kinase/D-beta-D-heptose 1-phosphate adenosyltransferase
MKKIVIATGGFDPIHSGHIAYLNEAKQLGDFLIVGLNSDDWLQRKKGKSLLSFNERFCILSHLKMVDFVINFDDSDNSAKNAILKVRSANANEKIIFANGGDRTSENIPEMSLNDDNLEFVFGVGGNFKMNSSSWILNKWNEKH